MGHPFSMLVIKGSTRPGSSTNTTSRLVLTSRARISDLFLISNSMEAIGEKTSRKDAELTYYGPAIHRQSVARMAHLRGGQCHRGRSQSQPQSGTDTASA